MKDLGSAVLVFFVLLISFGNFDATKFAGLTDSLQDAFGAEAGDDVIFEDKQEDILFQVRDFIERSNLTNKMVALPHGKGVLIRILGTAMFPEKSALLLEDADPILDQIIKMMRENDYSADILGHTDNIPIQTELFPSNWELSAVRATTVLRFIQAKGGFDQKKLVAIGYADTHPIADNDTDLNRAANRRVEIILERKVTHQLY